MPGEKGTRIRPWLSGLMQALAFLISWHCVWPLSKNLEAKVESMGGLGIKKKKPKKHYTFRGLGRGGRWRLFQEEECSAHHSLPEYLLWARTV